MTEPWLEFIKAYGLGAGTLVGMVWWLKEELKAARAREHKQNEVIIELTRESLQSMASVGKVIDALSPTIGQVSVKQQNDLNLAVLDLKNHISIAESRIISEIPDRV